jgi:hypothetical protein
MCYNTTATVPVCIIRLRAQVMLYTHTRSAGEGNKTHKDTDNFCHGGDGP